MIALKKTRYHSAFHAEKKPQSAITQPLTKIWGIMYLIGALFLLLPLLIDLITYPKFSTWLPPTYWESPIGKPLSATLFEFFGPMAYTFPILLGSTGICQLRTHATSKMQRRSLRKYTGFIAILAAGCGLYADKGGRFGYYIATQLSLLLNTRETLLILVVLFLLGLTLLTGMVWIKLLSLFCKVSLHSVIYFIRLVFKFKSPSKASSSKRRSQSYYSVQNHSGFTRDIVKIQDEKSNLRIKSYKPNLMTGQSIAKMGKQKPIAPTLNANLHLASPLLKTNSTLRDDAYRTPLSPVHHTKSKQSVAPEIKTISPPAKTNEFVNSRHPATFTIPSKPKPSETAKPTIVNNVILTEPVRITPDRLKPPPHTQIQDLTPPLSPAADLVQPYHFDLPALDLLDTPSSETKTAYSPEELTQLSQEVELRLRDFGIEVQVVSVHPGPVITRFEMQLAPGVKASRITILSKDLARSLSVISVRIVEIIPGKPVVGLELPNRHRETVRLQEILNTPDYQNTTAALPLALGKDIAGHPVIVNLSKMPHLLTAGTTGSGKSVGLNAMLLSILYKATPEQVRFILIDPKMLELSIYDGIPHLLTPVVTDMKEAANALRWCVAEMERRYKLMATLGVRNLLSYNQKIQDAMEKGRPIKNPLISPEEDTPPEDLKFLPYIVVLIDEFADMVMVVGKKIEELIARIAQKARAAGIHLILATQRPSVDVITGLIKANIPTRIAFQVSSRIDSRTILDQQGAEQLLGHGDMLYLAPGTGIPTRVHGVFIADQEVHRVVDALKQSAPPDYQLKLTDDLYNDQGEQKDSSGEEDPLYDQAVQIVLETRRASISSVQRRLKIGYNRAARLIESMESAGLVSAMESNGNREVLVPESIN